LQENATYAASKTMLVTTTDVRRSNSAAMYLPLASYAANGNRIVSDKREATAVLPSMARLFLGQGYSDPRPRPRSRTISLLVPARPRCC
jgi:hypothetical protein